MYTIYTKRWKNKRAKGSSADRPGFVEEKKERKKRKKKFLLLPCSVALWVEMIWYRRVHFINKNLFPMNSGASEWVSERCERMSERRSEWPSILRVYFVVILPNVERSKAQQPERRRCRRERKKAKTEKRFPEVRWRNRNHFEMSCSEVVRCTRYTSRIAHRSLEK